VLRAAKPGKINFGGGLEKVGTSGGGNDNIVDYFFQNLNHHHLYRSKYLFTNSELHEEFIFILKNKSHKLNPPPFTLHLPSSHILQLNCIKHLEPA
jgi:hypothetical protein